MKNLNLTLTSLSLLLAGFGQGVSAEQNMSDPIQETIKYEIKEKLEIHKAPPSIELNVNEIVESGTTRTEDVLQEAKPIPSKQDYEHYAFLDSDQALKPWAPLIPEPPLVTFYPGLSKVATKTWEFRVSNEEGKVVKIIKGKGAPPREFSWDGLDDRGHYIKVGTLYSYQFITYDEHGNAHTFPGEPFQLDALRYVQKKLLVIEFPNTQLFNKDQASIKPIMKGYWERAIDVIREYSNKPLTVEIYTPTVNSPLAEERRQNIVDSISDATNIPSVDIRHKVAKQADRGDTLRLVMKLR